MIRPWLPDAASIPLFGDRKRFGRTPRSGDPDWMRWEQFLPTAYDATQRRGIGKVVNDAGYRIMRAIDLDGCRVLEIGPGELPHSPWWSGTPRRYTLVDTRRDMLERSAALLRRFGIAHASVLVSRGSHLPFRRGVFDFVISFYSLEHLHPLGDYLEEIDRVLRRGGRLVGAIPCEGGLAWGAGRMLTTRHWLYRDTGLNMDKIICWEHVNFADDVLSALDQRFDRQIVNFWPARAPLIDVNLVARFIYAAR